MRRSAVLAVTLVVLSILLPAGCSLEVSQPTRTRWEASLLGSPAYVTVGGSAAALANEEQTLGGVTVTGLPDGTYAWRIRAGTCDAPGAVLGAEGSYPDLIVTPQEPDPENPTVDPGVSAEARITAPMTPGLQYHAIVQDAGLTVVVACGDFVQR